MYFAQYLIHATFINSGMTLLDLPSYMSRVWALRTALTKKDFEAAKVPVTAATNYHTQLAVFGLLLVNCISVPLLMPFGLLYFVARYNIGQICPQESLRVAFSA